MKLRLALSAAAVLLLMGGTANAKSANACDRACLTKVLDSYLTGVIRHDPKLAPLAANYRATENAGEVKAGDGLWRLLSGLGEVQRRYLDTINGSAAYFGLVNETGGTQALLSLRVRIVNRTVAEAEWIIARRGEALFNPGGLTSEPLPPQGAIPAKDRASRVQLEAAANSYFEGLQKKDGKLVLHVPGCVRLENGTKVTQRAAPRGAAVDPAHANEFSNNDCAAGLDRFAIRAVAHRRFPVIDDMQGVALGYGMFLRPADSRSQRLLLSEVFTTKGGKITGIYAAMYYMPPALPETMGW